MLVNTLIGFIQKRRQVDNSYECWGIYDPSRDLWCPCGESAEGIKQYYTYKRWISIREIFSGYPPNETILVESGGIIEPPPELSMAEQNDRIINFDF